MAYNINIPDADWSVQKVILGGQTFNIEMKYKERTKRWYLTLINSDGEILLSEKKCLNQMFITEPYVITGFDGGLFVERVYGDDTYPTRDNFGVGKEFELKYFPKEELSQFIHVTNGDLLQWLKSNGGNIK
ncbi:phage baseplate plug protein [Escherichia coli]|uniref:phage baseplate plug family protein n=1 Tax=Escherichia coli TaxID=562 RepID=UPI0037DDCE9F